MKARGFLIAGALLGATGVVLGAFGAHALQARLEPAALDTWDTAVTYQMTHAAALLVVGLLSRQPLGVSVEVNAYSPAKALVIAGWAFLVGTLLFSGSLYLLSLDGPRWLGPVTPFGGVAFVTGWLALAVAAVRT